MTAGSVLSLPDGTTLVPFSGSIPAAVTSTEGVDYYLALVDGATATRSPLVIEVLGDDGDLVGASGFHHLEVLSRPTVVRVPDASYAPGQVIADDDPALRALGRCGPVRGPMTLRATAVDADGVSAACVAQASIPSSFTSQGGVIAYAVTVDDGFQTVSSPPLEPTVTVGHLVLPLGLSL